MKDQTKKIEDELIKEKEEAINSIKDSETKKRIVRG